MHTHSLSAFDLQTVLFQSDVIQSYGNVRRAISLQSLAFVIPRCRANGRIMPYVLWMFVRHTYALSTESKQVLAI